MILERTHRGIAGAFVLISLLLAPFPFALVASFYDRDGTKSFTIRRFKLVTYEVHTSPAWHEEL